MPTEATRVLWVVALLAALLIVTIRVRRARRASARRASELDAVTIAKRWTAPVVDGSPQRRLILPALSAKRGSFAAPAILLRRPAPTRHPIVLAHGYLGFRREYFVGVRERLEAPGHKVHIARMAPAASVTLRAPTLARP